MGWVGKIKQDLGQQQKEGRSCLDPAWIAAPNEGVGGGGGGERERSSGGEEKRTLNVLLTAQPTLRLQKCSGKPLLTLIWAPLKGAAELRRRGMDEAPQPPTRRKAKFFTGSFKKKFIFRIQD